MHIGHIFPQAQVGLDPIAVRDYVQGVEALGFEYIAIADHVLAADPASWLASGRNRPHDDETYREPIVMLSCFAAWTQRLGLVTSILLLPQRPTALVAKQTAELDLMSGGRLRLGVGVGRIPDEYVALGQDFAGRGKRVEEQIGLLRRFWTEESVSFNGQFDTIPSGAIRPLPVQRPIPIWMGGGVGMGGLVDGVLRRVARLADGWCPLPASPDNEDEAWRRLKLYLAEAGRDPATFPYEARCTSYKGGPDDFAAGYVKQQERGVTHYTVDNRSAGYHGVDQHLESLRRWVEAVQPVHS